jgi:hypothetical protein
MTHTLIPVAVVVLIASVLIVALYGYVAPYVEPVVDKLR